MGTVTTYAVIDSEGARVGALKFNEAINSMRQGATAGKAAVGGMQTQILALAGAYLSFHTVVAGAKAIIKAADDFTLLRTRIAAVSGSAEVGEKTLSDLSSAADRAHVPVESLADAYAGMARRLQEKGRSETDGVRSLELLSKSMTASGASAQQTAQAYALLTNGVNSGRIEVRAFFELVERAPVLLEEFRKQTGLTTEQVRKLAEMGKISGNTLVSVLLNAADRIESRFSATPRTVGGAFDELSSKIKEALASASDTRGLVSAIDLVKAGVVSLADAVDRLKRSELSAEIERAARSLSSSLYKLAQDALAYSRQSQETVDVINNIGGAMDRAATAASKFSAALGGLRARGKSQPSIAPFSPALVTAVGSQPQPIKFEESDLEKQAKVLLQIEQQRGTLAKAMLVDDRDSIAAAKEEIEVRATVTKELRAANPVLAGQIEAQIRLNNEIQRQAELAAGARQFGSDFLNTINSGFLDGISNGQKFNDVLRSTTASLLKFLAQTLLLKPLEASFGKSFSSAFPGFDSSKILGGLFSGGASSGGWGATVSAFPAFAFADGGVLPGPTTFTSGGMRGIAGEAGAEAVLPLRRGPDGSMGVQMTGAAPAAAPIYITVQGDATDATVEKMRRVAQQEFARSSPSVVKASVSSVADEYRRNRGYLVR